MPLQLPEGSRFARRSACEGLPQKIVSEFEGLVEKIIVQGNRWALLEHFEAYFCGAIGAAHYRSSSESWANTDLMGYMAEASKTPELFLEAFYDAFEAFRAEGIYDDAAERIRTLRQCVLGPLVDIDDQFPRPVLQLLGNLDRDHLQGFTRLRTDLLLLREEGPAQRKVFLTDT